jgi:hypothetical protein
MIKAIKNTTASTNTDITTTAPHFTCLNALDHYPDQNRIVNDAIATLATSLVPHLFKPESDPHTRKLLGDYKSGFGTSPTQFSQLMVPFSGSLDDFANYKNFLSFWNYPRDGLNHRPLLGIMDRTSSGAITNSR